MRRSRISMILTAILVLALGASIACSGKKTEETPKAAATTAAASATAAPKTATTTAPATGAGGITTANLVKAMCDNWKSVGAQVRGGMPAGAPTGAPAGAPNLNTVEVAMKQMVDAAPPEIKPDFAVLAKFFGEYSAAMTRAGGDMMKLAQDAQFMKTMESGTVDVEKAGKNIDTWAQKNCS